MNYPLNLTKTFQVGANTLHFIPYQSYNAAMVMNACYDYIKTLDVQDRNLDIYAGTWATCAHFYMTLR